MRTANLLFLSAAGFVVAFVAALSLNTQAAVPQQAAAQGSWPALPGHEAMVVPPENPMTPAKVELGKMLYYDTRMSGDGKRSCYSCHVVERGLTDGRDRAGSLSAKARNHPFTNSGADT